MADDGKRTELPCYLVNDGIVAAPNRPATTVHRRC